MPPVLRSRVLSLRSSMASSGGGGGSIHCQRTTTTSTKVTPTRRRKRAAQLNDDNDMDPDQHVSFSSTINRNKRIARVTPEPAVSSFVRSSMSSSFSPTALFATTNTVASPKGAESYAAVTLPMNEFRDLNVPPYELRPSATLTTGQSFAWKDVTPRNDDDNDDDDSSSNNSGTATKAATSAWGTHDAQEWIGTLRLSLSGDAVVLHVRETPTTTLYKVLAHHHCQRNQDSEQKNTNDAHHNAQFYDNMLRSYFQLDEPLQPLYKEWSESCARMKEIANSIPGVRILRQDPWECLVSFICSSNNNIPRITSMLQSIRQTYGERICIAGDKNDNDDSYYSFPSPHQLSAATEQELRDVCGLGYRAKYIVQTTRHVLDEWDGESALMDLRTAVSTPVLPDTASSASSRGPGVDEENVDSSLQRYQQVREKLLELAGVGPKVADCVAMFSLDQAVHAIPVDVHVWNIAKRDYSTTSGSDDDNNSKNRDPLLFSEQKSMTPRLYHRVQQVFLQKFPNKTAWAHSLLFVAELPSFRAALPSHIFKEMDEFKKIEQEKKQKRKGQTKRQKEKAK